MGYVGLKHPHTHKQQEDTACSSQMPVEAYKTTHYHKPEDYNLNNHHCENFKTCIHVSKYIDMMNT
jgi:hypothetical protein